MATRVTIVHRTRTELAARPIAEASTTRGKELSAGDPVAAARALFANQSVRVLPVLDGATYVGAVDRDAIAADVPAAAPVLPFASDLLPTALAATPTAEALAALDRDGSTRLVVLAADGASFVGLVCLRSDRERLCVDAECHADRSVAPATVPTKGHLS